MSFVDESGRSEKSGSLKSAISQVQYEPEPTPREFLYGPVKPNLRRNLGVQESQIPTTQVGDVHTVEGQKYKAAKDEANRLEALYVELGHKERQTPGLLREFMKLLPSAHQLNAAKALKKGDVMGAFNQIQMEMKMQDALKRKQTQDVRSDIQTQRAIERKRKEKDDKKKKKRKQRVGEKGQKLAKDE